MHEAFIAAAIEEAKAGVAARAGGPFGAVIVRAGKVIGRGHNRVTSACDPTAHAEVVAIRDACQSLGSHSLSGTSLYASCEPCPMCLAASYWARIDQIYFAAGSDDAAAAGFDDAFLYQQFGRPPHERSLPMRRIAHSERLRPFELWAALPDRIPY